MHLPTAQTWFCQALSDRILGTTMEKLTILHVTESLGGGVERCIRQYIDALPEHTHKVMACVRQNDITMDIKSSEIIRLPKSPLKAIPAINSVYERLNPGIVHAHSSFAGAYVRMSKVPSKNIVYTPHCFSFERRDINIIKRAMFYILEVALSMRAVHFACVSVRELALSKFMRSRSRSLVPQSVPDAKKRSASSRLLHENYRVASVGRLVAQKDPIFFSEVAALSKALGKPFDFIWIGGGEKCFADTLKKAGVHVTGWLSRDGVEECLASADLYLHTALWEGAPLSIFEAASIGVPVVARQSPPFSDTDIPILLGSSPAELLNIIEMVADGLRQGERMAQVDVIRETFSPLRQRLALLQAYSRVYPGLLSRGLSYPPEQASNEASAGLKNLHERPADNQVELYM